MQTYAILYAHFIQSIDKLCADYENTICTHFADYEKLVTWAVPIRDDSEPRKTTTWIFNEIILKLCNILNFMIEYYKVLYIIINIISFLF